MLKLSKKTSQITKKIIVFYLFLIPLLFFLITGEYLYRFNTDFCQDYESAINLLSGKSIYLNNNCWGYNIIPHLKNPHPPFAILTMLPFVLLSKPHAHLMWIIFSSLFYLFSLILILIILDKFSLTKLSILLSLLLFWDPLRNSLVNQNTSQLTLFLLTLVLFLDLRKKYFSAGILLSFASLIRLWPAVYIIFTLLSRRFKLTASALLTMFIGIIATFIIIKPKEYITYFTEVLREENLQILRTDNVSFVSLIAKYLLNSGLNVNQTILPAKLIGASVFTAVIFITAFLTLRGIRNKNIYILAQSIGFNLIIFVFPVYWGWGLLLYLLVYAMLLFVLKGDLIPPRSWWVLFVGSFLMLFVFKIYVYRQPINDPGVNPLVHMKIIDIHQITTLFGVFLLFVAQVWLIKIIKNKANL